MPSNSKKVPGCIPAATVAVTIIVRHPRRHQPFTSCSNERSKCESHHALHIKLMLAPVAY